MKRNRSRNTASEMSTSPVVRVGGVSTLERPLTQEERSESREGIRDVDLPVPVRIPAAEERTRIERGGKGPELAPAPPVIRHEEHAVTRDGELRRTASRRARAQIGQQPRSLRRPVAGPELRPVDAIVRRGDDVVPEDGERTREPEIRIEAIPPSLPDVAHAACKLFSDLADVASGTRATPCLGDELPSQDPVP